MTRARFAWGVACNLVWAGALVIGAAVLISIVAPFEAGKEGAQPSPEIHRRDASQSECDTTKVTMQVPDGLPSAHYSLCDGEGNELIRVMYNRSGGVAVTWGAGFAVRAGCWATPGGAYDLTVMHGETEYRLAVRPDVVSGFTVLNRRTNERDGLSVTSGGWIVRGTSILE